MNPELLSMVTLSAIVISTMMLIAWLISLMLRDASIIDPFWGLGFALVAWAAFVKRGDLNAGSWLLPVLTTIWGARLGGYLAWRNHGKPEDYRYQAMRESWGSAFPLVSLFTVFILQGVIMWVVSLPIQAGIAASEQRTLWLCLAGIVLWATGLFFETVGDWQLAKFRADSNNKGRVLNTGLWRYTRHPNYFGDFLMWWGLYAVAVSQGAAYWTAIGPLTMSVFLVRVSGVTLLEKSLVESKPGYAEYVARTNAFIPGMPRG